MQVAIHHTGHKLDRMIGLEPSGLITDHRISRRVGFIKPIVGKFIQKVPGGLSGFFVHVIGRRAGKKLRSLRVHRLLDFFTHRTTQQIGPAQRIARHLPGNFHHLFLIHDDALGFIQDMIYQRMQQISFA